MYGVTFELDARILDELGIGEAAAYAEAAGALRGIGYVSVRHGAFVCPEPKCPEIQVVHDTIMALRDLLWFPRAAARVVAFEVTSWGDITGAFR